jgi:hypothetical protein
MADDLPESLPLFGGCAFIKRSDDPIHLALSEVAPEIPVQP